MTTDELARSLALPHNAEKLKAMVIALQEARAQEADRLRRAVQDRQDLMLELGSYREKLDHAIKQLGLLRESEESGVSGTVDLIMQALSAPRKPSLSEKILASVLLRLARRAARSDQYARAQALYEAIALFKPRPFLLKQIGTMLYHQRHYQSALDVLAPAQKLLPGDRDVNFLVEASEAVLTEAKVRR